MTNGTPPTGPVHHRLLSVTCSFIISSKTDSPQIRQPEENLIQAASGPFQIIHEELDRRIMSWQGDARDITREVLIPFAREHGYEMTEADVEYYNGHENDGSEVPSFLLENG